MKNQIIIGDVTIVKLSNGKLEFHIPTNMSGEMLVKFKELHKEEIDAFKLDGTLYHAKCDECSTPINEGYVLYGGEHYYCSDKCLHTKLTPEEWDRLNELDFDCYWTEWECEEDANYKLVNGELIEL
jgi:hypothetical protein